MSTEGAAELRRIIDMAEDVTPEAPLTGSVRFSRIPARAAGMGLTATDWRVLHTIGLHADKLGRAYPGLARIARIARINRNHVSRSTKRLEAFGLLTATRVKHGSVWAHTNYQLIFGDAEANAERRQTKTTASLGIKPFDGPVAPEVVPQGTRVAPEMVPGGTSVRSTGGTSDGALTDQLEVTKEEEEKEDVKNRTAGDTLNGSTRSVLPRPRTHATPPPSCPVTQDCEGDIPAFASLVLK